MIGDLKTFYFTGLHGPRGPGEEAEVVFWEMSDARKAVEIYDNFLVAGKLVKCRLK